MNRYKPEFMGKVIPADNPNKLSEFCTTKYDAFTKIYDACKEKSEDIKDISVVETDQPDALAIKVAADSDVMDDIKESADNSVSVIGNVVSASSSDDTPEEPPESDDEA